MITRRSFIAGLAGAAAATIIPSPEAVAQVFGRYDVPDQLLALYLLNQSKVGLPLGSAYAVTGGLKQPFANADMYFSSSTKASIILGKLKSAYDGAGGPAKLGLPIGVEAVSSTYSARTQGMSHARIWWSSAEGAKVVKDTKTVRLKGAKNFRDVAGEGGGISVRGGHMRRGFVYRSSALGSTTKMDRYIMQTLGIGTMIRLSPSGTPSISGIVSKHYGITNPSSQTLAEKQAMYRGYVTNSSNRASIGRTVNYIAGSSKPVVFQCLRGWDRSGWVSAVIQDLLGASSSTIMTEFLKSNSYLGSGVRHEYLDAARSAMRSRYGTVTRYANACGVSSATITKLRQKLIV